MRRTYLGGTDPRNPDASPFHAPALTGLPPTMMLTVEHDPLRHEGILYAQRLRESGVDVTELDVAGHVHGSLSIPALYDGIDEMHAAIADFVRASQSVQTAGEPRRRRTEPMRLTQSLHRNCQQTPTVSPPSSVTAPQRGRRAPTS